jgi:hypothetical protein
VATINPGSKAAASGVKAVVRGRILDAQGLPVTTKGSLYYEFTSSDGNVTKGTADSDTDSYSIELPPGVVWLKYFADGYAPAWLGPLTLSAGQKLDDVDLKLTKGHSATLLFVNQQGQPIPTVSVSAYPVVGLGAGGPHLPQLADDAGRLRLEHLADAPYELTIEAAGFQPLRISSRTIGPDENVTLTLKESRPARGVLLTADGQPAARATLRMRVAAMPGNRYDATHETVATADAEGRFSINQLSDDAWYLVLAEAVDGANVMLPPVRAGQDDIRVTIPRRRDLRVKLVGDLSGLPVRRGKPYISIRQPYEFRPSEGVNFGDLIGEDAIVTPTAAGGVVEFKGLLPGEVKIVAGSLRETLPADTREGEFTLVLPAAR